MPNSDARNVPWVKKPLELWSQLIKKNKNFDINLNNN